MRRESSLVLSVLFGMVAIGSSAQEAPPIANSKQPRLLGAALASSGSALAYSSAEEFDRGDPFAAYRSGGEQGSSLFDWMGLLLRGGENPRVDKAPPPTVVALHATREARITTVRNARDGAAEYGYLTVPSLDELRSAGIVKPPSPKGDRVVARSERRQARLARSMKMTRGLNSAEEARLSVRLASRETDRMVDASRQGPVRGLAAIFGDAIRGFRISEPITSEKKYGMLVERYARAYGVPVELAHAVIKVESNYRADARGRAGEVGLMQIKPATARMMGYSGSVKDLYSPENNIKYGMMYLGKARKLGGGTTCGTILKYNAGHAARRMNRVSSRYCAKVKQQLRGT